MAVASDHPRLNDVRLLYRGRARTKEDGPAQTRTAYRYSDRQCGAFPRKPERVRYGTRRPGHSITLANTCPPSDAFRAHLISRHMAPHVYYNGSGNLGASCPPALAVSSSADCACSREPEAPLGGRGSGGSPMRLEP